MMNNCDANDDQRVGAVVNMMDCLKLNEKLKMELKIAESNRKKCERKLTSIENCEMI